MRGENNMYDLQGQVDMVVAMYRKPLFVIDYLIYLEYKECLKLNRGDIRVIELVDNLKFLYQKEKIRIKNEYVIETLLKNKLYNYNENHFNFESTQDNINWCLYLLNTSLGKDHNVKCEFLNWNYIFYRIKEINKKGELL